MADAALLLWRVEWTTPKLHAHIAFSKRAAIIEALAVIDSVTGEEVPCLRA